MITADLARCGSLGMLGQIPDTSGPSMPTLCETLMWGFELARARFYQRDYWRRSCWWQTLVVGNMVIQPGDRFGARRIAASVGRQRVVINALTSFRRIADARSRGAARGTASCGPPTWPTSRRSWKASATSGATGDCWPPCWPSSAWGCWAHYVILPSLATHLPVEALPGAAPDAGMSLLMGARCRRAAGPLAGAYWAGSAVRRQRTASTGSLPGLTTCC